MMQPPILLLREGTDSSQGVPQLVSNINACCAIVDIVRSTLGPRGMDKLVYDDKGKVTISNDGATIMKLLDVVHPAASTLVDIAKSQDSVVGDGTTSVVILAGELLKQAKPFVEENLHPANIIRSYRKALVLVQKKIKDLSVSLNHNSEEKMREMLMKCAMTTLNSKLIRGQSEFFAKMVVDAVFHLDKDLKLDLIGIKKVQGGGLQDSLYVEGVAFKKTFSYAGFEQQPKKFQDPKVLLLNVELELKAEKDNAEVRINDPEQYQAIVDAEWEIIYDKLDKIVASGAQVVLSKLPIGDLATQYFADRNIFCAGRVPTDDMERVSKATGGYVQSSVNNLTNEILGTCAVFEEKVVGGERFNFFSGCPETKTVTIILRGGAEQFIEEAERSLHDAIMIVRRTFKSSAVVGGGGAIEMELSRFLLDHSKTIAGRDQLLVKAFAKALEVIPHQLCDNAGFDSTEILNKLRQKHAESSNWYGVDILNEGICDTFESFVWEPALVKLNALTAATEASCMILSVDETVKNNESDKPGLDGRGFARTQGDGMGRPMRR